VKPSEHIEMFLMDQDLTPRTKASYKLILEAFFRYVVREGILFTSLNRSHILNFKNELINKGRSAGTVNMYLTVLRMFYRWLDYNHIYDDITKGIEMLKQQLDYSRAALTPNQVRTLLNQIDTDTIIGKRDYAIIILMLHAGLRTIEVHRLDIDDLYHDGNNSWLKIMGKGRKYKDTNVYLTKEAYRAIINYIAYHDDKHNAMFRAHDRAGHGNRLSCRYIRGMVKRYLIAAGLVGREYNTHSMRHTCAINAMNAGASLYDVQLFMRHSNPKTTELYLRSIRQQKIKENKVGKLLAKTYEKITNDGDL